MLTYIIRAPAALAFTEMSSSSSNFTSCGTVSISTALFLPANGMLEE